MKKVLFTSIAALLTMNTAVAQTAEERGLAIAQEVDHRDTGWRDADMRLKMVLRNRQGEESTRLIRLKLLEVNGDGDKTLTIFDEPRDVKGTAFLSFSHSIKADDQWLYLPALKRVKRIASANKSGPFMGSQFAYEDLASFEVAKYRYKYLRDEKLNSHAAFVVENIPQYKYSGYSRQLVWIDQQRYIPLKVEYYDRKNALLKTLHFNNYKQYQNQYWRAHEQVMKNHQTGKITVLSLDDYRFGIGLKSSDFVRTRLTRVR